jgi:predicted phosphodiesterase
MERCAEKKADVIVLGHTHYPMSQQIGKTLLINPGSVGQPRNRQPGAHWALFETATGTLDLFCETYDSSSVVAESRNRHPELPYIADVLTRS